MDILTLIFMNPVMAALGKFLAIGVGVLVVGLIGWGWLVENTGGPAPRPRSRASAREDWSDYQQRQDELYDQQRHDHPDWF